MAEFVYNNAKNVNIGYLPFELNCNYYPSIFFEDEINPYSKQQSINKPVKEMQELISICQQNLFHAQKLPNRAYDKSVKPCSCAPDKKVWLNSKYNKTK